MSDHLLGNSIEALVRAGMAIGRSYLSQTHILIEIMDQIDLLDEDLGSPMELSPEIRKKLLAYSFFYEHSECTKEFKIFRKKGFRILTSEKPKISDLFHFALAFGVSKELLHYVYCDLDDNDMDIDMTNVDKDFTLNANDLFSPESIREMDTRLRTCCTKKSGLGLITYIREHDFHSFF